MLSIGDKFKAIEDTTMLGDCHIIEVAKGTEVEVTKFCEDEGWHVSLSNGSKQIVFEKSFNFGFEKI